MSFSLDGLQCMVPLSPERIRSDGASGTQQTSTHSKIDAIVVHVVNSLAKHLCERTIQRGIGQACTILQIAQTTSDHRQALKNIAPALVEDSELSEVHRISAIVSDTIISDALRVACFPTVHLDRTPASIQNFACDQLQLSRPGEHRHIDAPCGSIEHKHPNSCSDTNSTSSAEIVSLSDANDCNTKSATDNCDGIEVGINDLPFEILVLIFRLSSTHLEILQILSQVCSHWLAVCQSLVGNRIDLSDPITAGYVTDSLLYSLQRFSLESVNISNCNQVSEAGIYALARLKLKSLIARNLNLFTLSIIHLSAHFQELDEIDLSGTQVSGRVSSMQKYAVQKSTRVVHLGGLQTMLTHFPSLEVASLESDTQRDGALQSCKHLRALKVSQSSLWKHSMTNLHSVESLELVEVYIHTNRFFPPRPTWSGLVEIIEEMPLLTSLKLDNLEGRNFFLNDDAVREMMACRPALESLCIRQSNQRSQLTDEALRHIADRSQGRLQSLELPRNDHFTGNGFVYLLERLPHLQKLVVASCPGFSDVALSTLAHCCPLVRELNISRCIFITDSSLRQAIALLGQLRVLKAYGVHHAMMGSMSSECGGQNRLHHRRGGHGGNGIHATTSIRSALLQRGVQVHYRKHMCADDIYNEFIDGDSSDAEGINSDGTVCAALSDSAENSSDALDCRCREIACSACCQQIRSCRRQDHLEVCSSRAVECPCCRHQVPHASLAHHFATECIGYVVKCGACRIGVLRKHLATHAKQCRRAKDCNFTATACPLRVEGCQRLSRPLPHMEQCRHWSIMCACGTAVLRSQWNAHVSGSGPCAAAGKCIDAHRRWRLPHCHDNVTEC
eukprot:m.19839 g.19839  ORF g.19839 m.19839 type:complete len:845 (-) comp11958_c1_seq1:115-2649(-)